GDFRGVLGHVKAGADMALCAQVVDLVGANVAQDLVERAGVVQITINKVKAGVLNVRVLVDVVDATGVEGAGTADDAVDVVVFAQQKLGKVGAILARNAGDQGFLTHFFSAESTNFKVWSGTPRQIDSPGA